MKVLIRFCVAAAILAIVAAASYAPASAAMTPVVVKQCFITKPKALSTKATGTQIDYVIYGHKNAASIEFAVGYRNAEGHYLRRVTDVGNFAPGAEIRHHFSLYNDVTYSGQQTTACAPLQVKWADSTVWMAPTH
jgi:hypothetical protein